MYQTGTSCKCSDQLNLQNNNENNAGEFSTESTQNYSPWSYWEQKQASINTRTAEVGANKGRNTRTAVGLFSNEPTYTLYSGVVRRQL